jgi:hypothetical protein
MDWKRMAAQAKKVFDERGGTKAAKEDVEELRDIAEGRGTVGEKLGRAAKAVKEPGARRQAPPRDPAPGAPADDALQRPSSSEQAP